MHSKVLSLNCWPHEARKVEQDEENVHDATGREADRSFVHHAASLAQGRKDSPARNPAGRTHRLGLARYRYRTREKSEGTAEAGAEAEEGWCQMRVAIYARVSTTNNGQDPTMQTRELKEYIERRGWKLAGEYVDVGISGSKE